MDSTGTLSSEGFASMSPKVLEEMLAKHSPTNSRGGGYTLPDIKMSIDVVREEALATLTPLHVGVGVELG